MGKDFQKGFVQIPLIVIGVLVVSAIALPLVSNLVSRRVTTQQRATSCEGVPDGTCCGCHKQCEAIGCVDTGNPNDGCDQGCWVPPTNTPIPVPTTDQNECYVNEDCSGCDWCDTNSTPNRCKYRACPTATPTPVVQLVCPISSDDGSCTGIFGSGTPECRGDDINTFIGYQDTIALCCYYEGIGRGSNCDPRTPNCTCSQCWGCSDGSKPSGCNGVCEAMFTPTPTPTPTPLPICHAQVSCPEGTKKVVCQGEGEPFSCDAVSGSPRCYVTLKAFASSDCTRGNEMCKCLNIYDCSDSGKPTGCSCCPTATLTPSPTATLTPTITSTPTLSPTPTTGGGGIPTSVLTPTPTSAISPPEQSSPIENQSFQTGGMVDLVVNPVTPLAGSTQVQYKISFTYNNKTYGEDRWSTETKWTTGPYNGTGTATWRAKSKYYDNTAKVWKESAWSDSLGQVRSYKILGSTYCEVCPNGSLAKTLGNANCDNAINSNDFDLWKSEFFVLPVNPRANFNCGDNALNLKLDFNVDLKDFEIWRRNSLIMSPTPTVTQIPTAIPTLVSCHNTCLTAADCKGDLRCWNWKGRNQCVNPNCANNPSCICPTLTPTPTTTSGQARIYTVCPTGTKGQNGCDFIGGDGIQEAVDAAPVGTESDMTTILFKSGDYSRDSTEVGRCLVGIGGKYIIFKGEGVARLIGRNGDIGVCAERGKLEIRDLKFKNFKGYNSVSDDFGRAIFVGEASVGLFGNTIESDCNGVLLRDVSEATIIGNTIIRDFANPDQNFRGITVEKIHNNNLIAKVTISANKIFNSYIGILIDNSADTENNNGGINLTLNNNLIFKNIAHGLKISGKVTGQISNNLFYQNYTDGLIAVNGAFYGGSWTYGLVELDLRNNLFVKNTFADSSIVLPKPAGLLVQRYDPEYNIPDVSLNLFNNLFWQNFNYCAGIWPSYDGYDAFINKPEWCTVNGSLNDIDPKFVNEINKDFHLQSNSPAKNAGDPSILDPDGSRSDMGAYGGPGACDLDSTLPGCPP